MISSMSDEMLSYRSRSVMHHQLKKTRDYIHHVIVLFFEAMLAFASTFNENTTHVNCHYAQMMNAATASDLLIMMI